MSAVKHVTMPSNIHDMHPYTCTYTLYAFLYMYIHTISNIHVILAFSQAESAGYLDNPVLIELHVHVCQSQCFLRI